MFTPSCIAHCQSVSNEHPAALWGKCKWPACCDCCRHSDGPLLRPDWPERWGIEGLTPQKAFDEWYAAGGVGGSATKHVQQCAWSPTECNKLCPLWT